MKKPRNAKKGQGETPGCPAGAGPVPVNLFLDDERVAPPGWTRVRTAQEAISLLQTGRVGRLSLDHDLGDDDEAGTGYDVIRWIEEAVAMRGFTPPEIFIHTANPAGRARMEAGIRSILRLYEETKPK